MKKWLSIILIVMLLGLTACGADSKSAANNDTANNSAVNEVSDREDFVFETVTTGLNGTKNIGGKGLVVYFSRSGENWNVGTVEKGSTQLVAEYIADKTDSDIYRLEPETEYPDRYTEMLEIASEEQKENARPKIKTQVSNWEEYDKIYLGYPIWDGDMPMIVYSFLESRDFAGKMIYPFDTHGGSGLAGTVASIRHYANGAEVMKGLGLLGEDVQKDFGSVTTKIDDWLKKK